MAAPRNHVKDPEATVNEDGFLFGEDDTNPAGRQALSRADLLARLSALIQTGEGCEHVKVIDVTRFDAPDSDGCNWSMSVVLDPAGVAPEVYALAYAQMIVVARAGWNLK
jgi:hypothetical protein